MDLHVIIHNPIIKKGTAPAIRFTAYDNEGEALDLTNAQWVLAAFKRWNTSTEYFINHSCTVTNAEEGEFELLLTQEDTTEDGRFIGEIEIAFGDNSMDRCEDLVIWLLPSIRSD
jgi:hypothetical protein